MKQRNVLVWLLVVAILFSMTACQQPPNDTPATTGPASETTELTTEVAATEPQETDSEASGKAEIEVPGYGGPIQFSVAFEGGALKDIAVVNDYETPGVGKTAMEMLIPKIIENQSLKVEAVSGATVTSNAVIRAVKQAMTELGLSENALNKELPAATYETEKTADVVIIGGGGAGLAAAVSATDNDASVIVIEKTGLLGGNTVVCGGIYNTPDPVKQEKQNIEDSPELFKTQTLEGGDNVGNPALVETMTSKALDGLKWLESMGMRFDDTIIQGAGSLYPRTHQSLDPLGTGFINAYVNTLNERKDKVDILLNTKGESLIVEDGKVTGVKATNPDGSELTLHANKGVIVATGGFSKNMDMALEYNTTDKWPNLTKDVVSTNRDAMTGDGVLMAKEAGADLVDMEQLQFLYLGIPKLGPISGLFNLGAENTIFVNNNGERFVREDGRRDVISRAIFEQPEGQMWYLQTGDILKDEDTAKSLEGVPMKYLIENGIYGWVKGDSIEELAEKIGCPPENLKKTVEEFNKAVDEGNDPFERELLTKKLETGPWYALPRVPALHHTMGGIRIDTECRALNAEGTPVQGLYAAGEVTGGIHGANRLGGNAVVDTVVFGRIAGESAALGK